MEMGGAGDCDFEIEQRIADREGNLGTVKYIGVIGGYDPEVVWVGIEWDNVKRGRHNGSYGGVRYFSTSDGADRASFVKPVKLSKGRTFVEGLRLKYDPENANERMEDDVDEAEMWVHTIRGRHKKVQVVGVETARESMKKLDQLTGIFLPSFAISSMGEESSAGAIASSVVELDLSMNLIESWETLVSIPWELPKLRTLNVSSCRLPNLESELAIPCVMAMRKLRVLVLNGCNLTFETILCLQGNLEELKELHLCDNRIKILQSSMGKVSFPALELLNLDDNLISDWSQVASLGSLPSLEKLYVSGNPISDIIANDSEGSFPKLECLLVGRCSVSTWKSVDALNSFSALKEFRLQHCPLLDVDEQSGCRYEIIARVRNLAILNGSKIDDTERRDAEIRYVRRSLSNFGKSWESTHVQQLHPRLRELKDLYDISVDEIVPNLSQAITMGASMLTITFLCVGKDPITKRIPGSISIRKVKLLVQRLFQLQSNIITLYFKEEDKTPVSEQLQGSDSEPISSLLNGRDPSSICLLVQVD